MTIEAIGNIDGLAGLSQLDKIASPLAIHDPRQLAGADKAASVGFATLLQGGVGAVNETLKAADQGLNKLALNQPVSTHELMITMEKAKLQLQMAIEVRNKLLEGYQEIMRMQL